MKKQDHADKHLIGCVDCGNKVPFDLPKSIVDACLEGKLVVFAGAGISTEGKGIFPFTLYDDVKAELGIESSPSFPELMSKLVERTSDKRELLQRIKKKN